MSNTVTNGKIIIAIDGYSACGKSTTAKQVAAALQYGYIDTGAMYRAVTLYFHDNYVELTNPKAVDKALSDIHITFVYNPKLDLNEAYLNGLCIEKEIRKMYISDKVSEVSALHSVRVAMVAQQQKMGRKRGVVMDGRDIGTAVFPDAELKIFMTADMQVRALRRQQELFGNNQLVALDAILHNLAHRDNLDTTRKENPLVRAEDAHLLDTTHRNVEDQVAFVVDLARVKTVQSDGQNNASVTK